VLLELGVVVTVLAVAAVLGPMPGVTRACPAVGYAYVGGVELVFSTPPESVSGLFRG
jgi:hypothetical protein